MSVYVVILVFSVLPDISRFSGFLVIVLTIWFQKKIPSSFAYDIVGFTRLTKIDQQFLSVNKFIHSDNDLRCISLCLSQMTDLKERDKCDILSSPPKSIPEKYVFSIYL